MDSSQNWVETNKYCSLVDMHVLIAVQLDGIDKDGERRTELFFAFVCCEHIPVV